MRFQGKISNWNDDKGFGFVEPNGGGTRCFVHIKSFQKRSRRPVNGDLITYEQVHESSGKHKAINIGLVSDRNIQKNQSKHPRQLGSVITIIFCGALILFVATDKLPTAVLLFYLGASVVAFFSYWLDKSAAQNNQWRTPESYLHLVSLIGGWPGAFYAQNKLRHKTSKREFKSTYWITVVLNICGFMWLLSEQGRQFL